MPFGSELSKGSTSLKGKLGYKVLGVTHMGARVRKFYMSKMIKNINSHDVILDAGSGSGCYSFYFSRKFPHSHIVGIDIDGNQISKCQKIKARLNRSNLEFIQGDLRKYAPLEKFDLIYSLDVIEHIDDDRRVLINLNRALKPNGVLILHLPRKRELHKLHFKRFKNRANQGHVRDGYLKEEVITKLKESHFVIKEFKNTCGKFASLSTELQLLVNETKHLHSLLRIISFPFLITLAYLDTLLILNNEKDHQGFLVIAVRTKNGEK